MSESTPPVARPGVAFAGLFAVTFCGLVAVGAVLPVLPRYVHGPLGAGNVAVGVVVGCYAVTGLLLRPLAGRLADHRGRKPTVLGGSILVAIAGFLYLLPFGVPGLIGARLVLGAGEGTVFTAGSAWIVDIAPAERRGRVIGLYGLAVWSGLSIGPLVGELLLHASGYTAVWIFAGAAPLVGALIASRLPDPFHARPGEDEHHPLIAREAVRPGAAMALGSLGYATVASFVVLHLEARGVGHGALVFGVFATMIVLTRLVGGDLPDRAGPVRVAIVAALVEAAGLVTVGLAHSLGVAVVGAMAMGVAFALLYPSLSLIVVGRVPETRRGAALGTFTACFDAGVGIGAPLAGIAAALTDYEGAFLFAAAIALGSAAMTRFFISARGGAVEALNRWAKQTSIALGGGRRPRAFGDPGGDADAGYPLHFGQQRGRDGRDFAVFLFDRVLRADDDAGPLQRVAEDFVEGGEDRVGEDVGAGNEGDPDHHREGRTQRPRLARPEALDREPGQAASRSASSARSHRRPSRGRRRGRSGRRAG